MKPPPFDYAVPTTLDEAVSLLTEHADVEARVLAGGQSLIPMMNFRLAKPGFLVDLRRVAGLAGIRREGDTLIIGAMTRMSEVEQSPEVAVAAPLLTEAIGLVAHAPVRNSGTVGGSLAHADPAAELPAVAVALDAELDAVGPAGTRTIRAAEFFTGPYSTALAPEEILTEVRLPVWPGGHAFIEFSRIYANFAVVAVAALVEAEGQAIRRVSVALAGVGPVPVRAHSAEQALAGSDGDPGAIREAARSGAADLAPAGDLHASAETRRSLAETYLRRGLELATARARNER